MLGIPKWLGCPPNAYKSMECGYETPHLGEK